MNTKIGIGCLLVVDAAILGYDLKQILLWVSLLT
jgi:hypothetical protein